MEDLPFSIRKHLFNINKYIDQKIYSNEEYKQRRLERIKEAFPKFCPNCQFPVDQNYCPVCGTEAVFPMYCQRCDILVESEFCPQCGKRIYFCKIKSGVKVKDQTVFPN